MPQKKQTEEQVRMDLDDSVELVEQQPKGKGSAAHESESDEDVVDAIWESDVKKYHEMMQKSVDKS